MRAFFRRYWWAFALAPVVVILLMFGTLWYAYAHTTIPLAPPGPQTTYLYDRHGHLIATLHAEVNRTIIPFDQIPQSVRDAVIAVEDKNYYHEGGVSPFAIVRAAWADLTHGSFQQGGSTITQQYVKNVYTGSERTFARKIREALLAVKLAHQLSKDEILAAYLNTVYFGNGAYGVQAAAETYWGIPARKLSPLQSATLAATINAPAIYDPVHDPATTRGRRDLVLQLMAQQGYLAADQAAQLEAQPLTVDKPTVQPSPHGYFVSYVSQALQQQLGYEETFAGGLRVTTSLDLSYQLAAEKAVATRLPKASDPNAALVAIDPTTGAILAMVGGHDFNKVQLNLATQAHRQAGSAFKPFTLATAMGEKVSLDSIWNGPSSITIPDKECYTNGAPWKVSNYADESAGTMTLADATAHSVNTIFAQVVVTVGPGIVASSAKALGITTALAPVCSITLGSQLVTPLDMADAYASFAARGMHHVPYGISLVTSPSGTTLIKTTVKGDQAMTVNDADLVTSALQGVIEHGTGVAAAIGRPAAGKTGTAQGFVDAWFCGYTPQLAACVWMGYRKGETPMHNIEGYADVFGGSLPALIWHDFMASAMAKLPVKDFAAPSLKGYNTLPKGAVSPSPSPSPTPSHSPIPSPSPTPSPSPSPSPTPSPSPSEVLVPVGLTPWLRRRIRARRRGASPSRSSPRPHRS